MSKNKKIIIIIILALLIIIPISTLATLKLINVPILNNTAIEEANQKETERALAEKAKFAQEHKNDVASINQENISQEFSQEEKNTLAEEQEKSKTAEDKVKIVMNKYYQEDFTRILNDIQSNSNNQNLVNISDSSIPIYEYHLYNLILKVLEEENLSQEDRIILKNCIKTFKSNIEQDTNLNIRAEQILN